MNTFMMNEKSKSRKTKSEVLALLDSFDKELPANPGPFSSVKSDEGFQKTFEDQIKDQKFKSGQIVQGRIMKVTDDHIIVDINYKSEGIIPRSEFCYFNEGQKQEPKENETIDVYIEQIEDQNGVVILSKDKANIKKVWETITNTYNNEEVITGKVIAAVKGGLTVDVGIKAFLPSSQLDVRPVRNLESFVGQSLECRIIKLNYKRGNIVLSRRAILEKERANLPSTSDIKEGTIVQGVVKNITSYGAFIDLGQRDGLLYITDMSWFRIKHPSQILKLGQKLDLKVLKIDEEKNRISLGLKQLSEEKWEEKAGKYEVGQVIKGKVSSVLDYGVFVLLDEDLEGLVHLNELSWNKKSKPPVQVFKPGDEVSVKIIDIKTASRKVSLSIKQTQESPWLKVKDKYQAGDIAEFEVVSISEFGLFVKITDEIDGLIRSSDLSWNENIRPSEKYKIGDKLKAKVLDIDIENEKFSLGVKQLKEDPWSVLERKYPVGSRHELEVIKIVDFGAFVRVEGNIEGLIHISELSKTRVNKVEDAVKVGDKVKAEVLNIDKVAKKIGLSIRLVESESPEDESVKKELANKKPAVMENFFAKALKKSINKSEGKKEDD